MESKLFKPIQISLCYLDDQASRKIRQDLIWTFYLKISFKLESLFANLRNLRLKKYLSKSIAISNKGSSYTVSPFAMTEYSWTYWRKQGEINLQKLLDNFPEKDHDKNFSCTPSKFHNLAKIICKYHGYHTINAHANEDSIFLFDSEHFFNGGHLANVEETLDIIATYFSNAKCYFFLDKHMLLFPTAAKLVTSKYKFCEVIDVTSNTLCFATLANLDYKISLPPQASISESVDFNILHNSHFNPCLNWNSTESQAKLAPPVTAWASAFSKEESYEIVRKHFQKIGLDFNYLNYVVLHSRNSNFLAPNIRSSLPLTQRESLIEQIKNLNLAVIVAGINKPEDKYKANDVIYLDEIGSIDDSFQMHILNGALALIGSPSGLTHMTYCTNTPTLLFDVPFPRTSCLPTATWLSLMKIPTRGEKRLALSEYYKITMNSYEIETDARSKAKSPLSFFNIELNCNECDTIFTAFLELIVKHYGLSGIKKLGITISNYSAESFSNAAMQDRELINQLLLKFSDSGKYRAFNLDSLAKANWKNFE